jgi:hypothetical protein
MDYLCECSTDRDRREALRKLPPDLPSCYERILERVNRSSKENQELVKKTLHWIVYHVEPFFGTDELLQALAVHDEENSFNRDSMPTAEDVLHWCSSLGRRNPDHLNFELAHFTVKEFLEAIDPIQMASFQQYRLSGDHTILAKACLNFIRCQEFDGLPRPPSECDDEETRGTWDDLVANYKFIEYSTFYWSHHVHNANWDDIANEVWDMICVEGTCKFRTFGWFYCQGHEDFNLSDYFGNPQSPTGLHWAALFALDKLCAILIERGMNVTQPSVVGTPLYCALRSQGAIGDFTAPQRGHFDVEHISWGKHSARLSVVQQLLQAGTSVDAVIDPKGQQRPLTIALSIEIGIEQCEEADSITTFIAAALLDAGAKLYSEDLAVFHQHLD